MYYVNSNSLLTELRGLTKHYPFRYVSWHAHHTTVVAANQSTALNALKKRKEGYIKIPPQTDHGTIAG
jgi:hypothetical protein